MARARWSSRPQTSGRSHHHCAAHPRMSCASIRLSTSGWEGPHFSSAASIANVPPGGRRPIERYVVDLRTGKGPGHASTRRNLHGIGAERRSGAARGDDSRRRQRADRRIGRRSASGPTRGQRGTDLSGPRLIGSNPTTRRHGHRGSAHALERCRAKTRHGRAVLVARRRQHLDRISNDQVWARRRDRERGEHSRRRWLRPPAASPSTRRKGNGEYDTRYGDVMHAIPHREVRASAKLSQM